MFTLAKMDQNTAAKMNIPDEKRSWYVRFDDAKTNITAPSNAAQWFKFESVALNNGTGLYAAGDQVGVLEHQSEDEMKGDFSDKLKADNLILASDIARIMVDAAIAEISITAIITLLMGEGKYQIKERAFRDKIKNAVYYSNNANSVIYQGYRCYLKYIDGNNKGSAHKIVLNKVEVNDQ
jgi:hypothetical protein